ncbi:nuclear transport factor 2 family protein [Streptomyces sp. CG1]|uniref:nuclear transport factor 2 family protein n=1 Tax=Streptomyces sp. CG1 TaxID=1287523 RepID=UPI0034E1D8DC
MSAAERTLTTLLQTWRTRFNAPDPEGAAALFTDDAVFQGLFPDPVTGPEKILGYYRRVPAGTRAEARVLTAYRGGDDWIGGLAHVVFQGPDGTIPVRLSVIAVRRDEAWHIRHYHVSRL